MKSILLLICAFMVLTTTGCIFPGHRGGGDYYDGGYRGHGEYRERSGYHHHSEPGVDVRIRAD